MVIRFEKYVQSALRNMNNLLYEIWIIWIEMYDWSVFISEHFILRNMNNLNWEVWKFVLRNMNNLHWRYEDLFWKVWTIYDKKYEYKGSELR